MRTPDELFDSADAVLHDGLCKSGGALTPLFSGGHDSLCATFIASESRWFTGDVFHIDTGIGANYTRRFVEDVCGKFGWNLRVFKSPATYERFVSELGFPGPGAHQWVYNWLKDRCVSKISKGYPHTLVTGCRSSESTRRMGFVEPVKVGELCTSGKNAGKLQKKNRIWTAPCHDWTKAEQMLFMDEFGLPTNRLKIALGLSGECFCGAYAQPGEREGIKEHAPDVDVEITRLTSIAQKCETPCIWGTRPDSDRAKVSITGPMCSSCDQRAAAAGVILLDTTTQGCTNAEQA